MTTAEADFSTVAWRKSSYSNTDGGNCVEVGWHKSTHSNTDGGDCVEVSGSAAAGATLVRDSKRPAGPVVAFGDAAWGAFVAGLRHQR
ncbi:DUF397 domain-containing protein [Streptomyces armeniacus]|uniref:DUF397 domain-containing protein n=1 Tax=Streptomyces armeniacus TaxID=83291 RepID=A0A345XTX5_9ACTN|nr:DUF397 domain-containing protein [Streptomyces armeniacus]AXK35091.1 DUF397 domain-containing protein [Streptomyces armeniacus]